MAVVEVVNAKCGACEKVIEEREKAIFCELFCETWFHSKCVKVSKDDYAKIQSLGDIIKWHCKLCEVRLCSLRKLNFDDFLSILSKVDKIDSKLDAIKTFNSDLLESVGNLIDSKLKSYFDVSRNESSEHVLPADRSDSKTKSEPVKTNHLDLTSHNSRSTRNILTVRRKLIVNIKLVGNESSVLTKGDYQPDDDVNKNSVDSVSNLQLNNEVTTANQVTSGKPENTWTNVVKKSRKSKKNSEELIAQVPEKSKSLQVRVHNPFEDPQGHRPVFIDVDKTTVIKILPKIITSSDNLATWNAADRGCYFNHERKLKFYKVYTQLNCEIECQANITLKQCGCNMFYQIYSFTESKICEPEQFQCVLNITNNEIGKEQNPCGCLPGCNEYEYEMRTYPTTQTWAETFNSSSTLSIYGFDLDRNKQKSYSSIKLEYNNEGIAKKSRIGIYSFTGFIAQIGGLLGLFVGFSLVSLIEIIYFSSIRWVATNHAEKMSTTFIN